MAMVKLSARTLGALPAAVMVPSYDRARLRAGIVHIGVGSFHRAHQAAYLDRLMNAGTAQDWAVCGVGLLPADYAMLRAMVRQDRLYTLVSKHPDGRWEPRVIGSLVDYLYGPIDPEAVIRHLSDPAIRLLTLTITEGGYNFHEVTGEFDADDPAVVADLADGATPRTVFGIVIEALSRRRAAGVAPFTVLSCDNIPKNGHVAARVFTAFAELRDPALADWIQDRVAFPSCMVDRITPVTTDLDRTEVRRRFDVDDEWPVVCEPFTQWVVEDRFPTGRPALEEVGVQFVPDVEPYELMKLRLLNGSHQALGYLGSLAGYRFVHEACADSLFREFLVGYMREAAPTLRPVPGIDLAEYQATLVERFANPEVRDTLTRLCAYSSDRVPKFVLPAIRDNLLRGGDVRYGAAVVAGWARYAGGADDAGDPIELVDPLADQLAAAARNEAHDTLAFIANRAVFGGLIDDPRFVAAYRWALDSLRERGSRTTLRDLVSVADG